MGRLKLLKQVAAGLARQFGPDCEIVIHDLKTQDLERIKRNSPGKSDGQGRLPDPDSRRKSSEVFHLLHKR